MGEVITQGHLGGYIAGGDPNTIYPELWTWLVATLGVGSVLDVGCGDGVAVDYLNNLLPNIATGIDGVRQDHSRIVCHDFAAGPFEPFRRYDLCWSCEFVEHVEEQYVDNFLAAFKACDLVLMTHAVPGQGGYHHVNEQESRYWIRRLAQAGFVLDAGLTETTRALAGHGYFERTGLALRRV